MQYIKTQRAWCPSTLLLFLCGSCGKLHDPFILQTGEATNMFILLGLEYQN